MAAGSGLAFLALAVVHGFWGWLVAWFVGSTLLGALSPLVDVITLREAGRLGFSYATPRGAGSAAYLFGNVAMGLVLARTGPVSVLAWTIFAAALTAVFAACFLPPTPVSHSSQELAPTLASLGEQIASLGALLRHPSFVLALVAVGLIQATHGFYYSFSILIWRQQGLGVWGGPLWGFAVGAEVLFMWFMEPFRRWLGPERLLMVGGAGALLRWAAFAFSPPLWALFPLQALHGVSFTATYLAGLRLIEQRSPAHSASAAQALNAALSSGVLIGVTTAMSGPLFAAFGARGYLVMAVLAAIGVGLAVWLARSPQMALTEAPSLARKALP
jgi:PPP family 3-phenylpropionic acid transporter